MNDQKIEQVLNEKIRPSLRMHGGDIKTVGISDGIYHFQLLGNCAQCPSAYLTTENLIRDTLLAAFGEIKEVVLDNQVSEELLNQARQILRKSHEG